MGFLGSALSPTYRPDSAWICTWFCLISVLVPFTETQGKEKLLQKTTLGSEKVPAILEKEKLHHHLGGDQIKAAAHPHLKSGCYHLSIIMICLRTYF